MHASQIRHLTRQIYRHLDRGDIEAVALMVTPDFVWTSAGLPDGFPFEGRYHGPDGLRRFWAEVLAVTEPLAVRLDTVTVEGEIAYACGQARARVRENGVEYRRAWTHYLHWRDGKLAAAQEHHGFTGSV